MNYRNIFIEFLHEFKEYYYNSVQLICLEKNNKQDLVNFLYDLEDISIFQSKGTQVFYKKRSLNNVQNTLVELALTQEGSCVYDLDEFRELNDVFNDEKLTKNLSHFVFVKPFFEEYQIKGVFLVFSDVRTEWMITDNKLNKLSDLLQNSIHEDLSYQIINLCQNKYWALIKDKMYLSDDLAVLTKNNIICDNKELKGYALSKTNTIKFLNCDLVVYEINEMKSIKSLYELETKNVNEYSLLYLESNDSETIDAFVDRLKVTLSLIDGSLGGFEIYQIDNDHLVLIFNKIITKKIIEEYFNSFKYILVRSGNELTQKPNFKVLVEYLKLSPIEAFNQEYYKYYFENYNIEKIKHVTNNIGNSKIKITPVFDSLNSNKVGYLIKDVGDIKSFDKNTKQKSILSMFKIVNEYSNEKLFIEMPLGYFFEGQKLSLAILNKVHKLLNEVKERIFIITDYNQLLNKIYAHWPDFNKYLYFYDLPKDLYQTLLSVKYANGLYFNSDEYRKFFTENNIIASEFLKFIQNDSKKILIKVKRSDIIKYQQENLLLVCD